MSVDVAQAPLTAFGPQDVVARIRSALPVDIKRASLHEPRFEGREREYLNDCIDTGWVSYAGTYVKDFEAALAKRCGVEHAIAVTSGTVALQVALVIGGLATSEEVLLPSLTFVASANAVVHAGGIPHFVDVDERTLGIDPVALASHLATVAEMRGGKAYNKQTGRRIAALLPVHVFGHPCDMDALDKVAADYGLLVVEDATEALGSFYKGRPCGSLSPLATLSFNGNKLVTTGGGGAILTSDDRLGERMRHMTTTAKKPHRWAFIHDEVAWNFRLPNINAALGLAQLERLDEMLVAKARLWQRYAEVFDDLLGITMFADQDFAESNHWLMTLVLDPGYESMLEPILAATNDAGLMTRPVWTPMHRLPMFAANPRASLAITESLAARIFSVPSSPFLAPA